MLEFDEDVSSTLSRVSLVGARTGPVAPLRVVARGSSALAVALPRLERDLYRVQWRTVAADDLHPTSGTLVFGVGSAVPATLAAGETSPAGGALLEAGLRWADLTVVSILIGALGTLLYLLPAAARRGARRLDLARAPLVRLALGACAAAALLGGGLLDLQLQGAGGVGRIGTVLTGTIYGRAWTARELLLVLLGCVLLKLRHSPSSRGLRAAAAILPVGIVASLALVSHAAAIDGTASVATALLAAHLLAATAWIGGVVALCLAMVALGRAGERAAVRTLALGLREPALVGVALLAITGTALLGVHVRTLDVLVDTGYGRTLLVKTALFALAGVLGLATTLALRSPRAWTSARPAWSWTPRIEAVALVALLAPAALLTASAPARGDGGTPPRKPAPAAAARSFASARDLVLSLTIEPNRAGTNFLTVGIASTRRPAPAPIDRVTLTLARGGSPARPLRLARAGGGEWRAIARLPAGATRIGIAVRRPGLPDATSTTAWTVSSRTPSLLAPAQAPAGFGRRPLEPVLSRVATAGGALLLAVLVFRLSKWRRPARGRPLPIPVGPGGSTPADRQRPPRAEVYR